MANGIRVGSSTFTQGFMGTDPLTAVYQGTNLIWPIVTPTPTPTPTITPTPTPSPTPTPITYSRYQLGNCAGGIPSSTDITFSYTNTSGNPSSITLNRTNASYRAINAQTGTVVRTAGDSERAQIILLGSFPANADVTKSITNLSDSNSRTISYTRCDGLVDTLTWSPNQTRTICFRNGITLPYQMYIPG